MSNSSAHSSDSTRAPATEYGARKASGRFAELGPEKTAELLDFRAPYLIEKLRKDRFIEVDAEGEELFLELKRYIVLHCVDPSKLWQMHSLRIDEVWHEFVLFTREYRKFCDYFLGGYFTHAPSNAPTYERDKDHPLPVATFDEFKAHYGATFGHPLPAAWSDQNHVALNRRLILNDAHGAMIVRSSDGRAELACAAADHSHVYVRIDEWAAPALRFMVDTAAFYLREIPGPMDDGERLDLCRALVRSGGLRVAP